jgi:hypothetical protein
VTAFLSFVAEWKYRIKLLDLIDPGSREPFFLHLFRGCLLFESLLKENAHTPPTGKTLNPVLQELASPLAIGEIATSAGAFNQIPQALSGNMSIQDSIESAVQARNTLGHNLVWMSGSLDVKTYDLLVKNIATSCIHAVSKLYP